MWYNKKKNDNLQNFTILFENLTDITDYTCYSNCKYDVKS